MTDAARPKRCRARFDRQQQCERDAGHDGPHERGTIDRLRWIVAGQRIEGES